MTFLALRSQLFVLFTRFWNFGLAQAGLEEVEKPRFESRPGMEYKLRGIESRPQDFPGFRRLGMAASSSSLKGPEILSSSGVRTFHSSDSCLLTSLGEPSGFAAPVLPRSSRVTNRWSLLRRVRGEGSVQPSKFINDIPRLTSGMRKVDGIDRFFPSLLLCLSYPRKQGQTVLSESVSVGAWREER